MGETGAVLLWPQFMSVGVSCELSDAGILLLHKIGIFICWEWNGGYYQKTYIPLTSLVKAAKGLSLFWKCRLSEVNEMSVCDYLDKLIVPLR